MNKFILCSLFIVSSTCASTLEEHAMSAAANVFCKDFMINKLGETLSTKSGDEKIELQRSLVVVDKLYSVAMEDISSKMDRDGYTAQHVIPLAQSYIDDLSTYTSSEAQQQCLILNKAYRERFFPKDD